MVSFPYLFSELRYVRGVHGFWWLLLLERKEYCKDNRGEALCFHNLYFLYSIVQLNHLKSSLRWKDRSAVCEQKHLNLAQVSPLGKLDG